jgi:small subunit ribosomal protein S11
MALLKKKFSKTRKRSKRIVTNGIFHISASFNNTLIAVTDYAGNVLVSASAGTSGFKGTRKSTPFAAQMAAEKVATVARDEFGMKNIIIYIKGPGAGRDSASRALAPFGFRILFIKDKTRLPYNGPRMKKRRRV